MKPIIRSLLPTLLAASLLSACASLDETLDPTSNWTAEELFLEGRESSRNGDYEGAIDYFEKLQARYPFGTYAQQAQLETAFAYYRYEEADAAIATLDRFIRTHPRHPYVDYAYYLKGVVNFSRNNDLLDRVLPSDPAKTDTASAIQAFRDFEYLVNQFPDSKYTDDAMQRMRFLRNNLAWYEVHVAQYYLRRKAFVAAAGRARYVLENYSASPATEPALAVMTQAYVKMDLEELARDSLRVLEYNYPDSIHISELENLVNSMPPKVAYQG